MSTLTGAWPGGAQYLFERNLLVFRRTWVLLVSGFFEPLFYLLSLGVGLDSVVGEVTVAGGRAVDYSSFIAPGLVAASAMNGAIFEGTNTFFKLRHMRTYDSVVTTPVTPSEVAIGEMAWAVTRGAIYSVAFLVVIAALGLVHSPWALLTLPAVVLMTVAFTGLSTAAGTYMRTWKDYELVMLVQLPMLLFTTTFYPLSVYPGALEWFIRLTPLYHGVELMRALTLGTVDWTVPVHVAYLVAVAAAGIWVATRRIHRALFV